MSVTRPAFDYAICWQASRSSTPVQPYWCSVTGRTEGKVTIRRGKQYELDQVQPGEATLTLRNTDGAFDPANTASPFAGSVLPYRLLRIRAQWPPTANLLTADQATAFYASQSGAAVGSSTLPANVTGSSVSIVAGSGASNAYQCVVSATHAAGQTSQDILRVSGWSVVPGSAHSGQFSLTTTASGSFVATLYWVNAAGAVIGNVAGTAVSSTGTSTLTVSGVAPANAAGAILACTTGFSSQTVVISALQVEQATAPSAWGVPGTWYSLFTGYVERWPQNWARAGTYGQSNLTVVDLFSYWSSLPMIDPFIADTLALNPNFYYPLNEGDGAITFADATRQRANIQIQQGQAAALRPGTDIGTDDNAPLGGYATDLSGGFLGSAGPTMNVTPAYSAPTFLPNTGAALLIPPNPSSGNIGPPTTGGWTRIIAGRMDSSTATAIGQYGWSAWSFESLASGQVNIGTTDLFGINISPAPGYAATMRVTGYQSNQSNPGLTPLPMPGLSNQINSAGAVIDGDWHLYAIGHDGSANLWAGVDGRLASVANPPPDTANRSNPSIWIDLLGALFDTQFFNWSGQLAHVIELPYLINSAQWQTMYQSWRNAWAGDTSDQRYKRIIAWVGASSIPTQIDVGNLTSYGPAVDIVGGSDPTSVLTALQNVVTSEIGQHFVSAAGTLTFQARSRRYNATPVAVFGENTGAGEIPYLDAQTDYDPTRLANAIQVNATYGNTVYYANDATSQLNYGMVGLQQDINSLQPEALIDGAGYLLYTNSQPVQRLEALPVDVGANPAAWPALLARELGDCVRVNRRPPGAPLLTISGFVEQISWDLSGDNTATWTAQVSNQARHLFAQLDSPIYGLLDSTAILAY